jgi:predicted glycoside hydrolase/deacetylase ChbG (UPF0249 family)
MKMPGTRTLILNADDIGLHPAVDQAVAQLAGSGIVTSASILTLAAPQHDALTHMREHGIDLGLHLDFTSALANRRYRTTRSVASTIVEAWSGRFDATQARAIVRDQLDRFGVITGHAPHFIDGHEHVHQLPVIRRALLDVLAEQKLAPQIFIRNPVPRRWRGAKAALIGMLGARSMARQAQHAGHRCNTDFFGVYDLRRNVDLPALWQGWLASIRGSGALAMCHPAASAQVGDTQAAPFRLREFQFLSSARFGELLAQYSIATGTWQHALCEA